jgi:hypothetical protein
MELGENTVLATDRRAGRVTDRGKWPSDRQRLIDLTMSGYRRAKQMIMNQLESPQTFIEGRGPDILEILSLPCTQEFLEGLHNEACIYTLNQVAIRLM